MRWSVSIGRIGGTAIRLHFTFLLFLGWIAAVYYLQGGVGAAVGGVVFLLLLFLCVVLHEFGHILAARHFGIATPEVVLLPIGGVSLPARIPHEPRQELLIALAGPMVSLGIALLLMLLLGGAPSAADFGGGPGRSFLAELAIANFVLLAFNLIPAFPMDGGRVLRAALASRLGHVRATRIAAAAGQGFAVLLGLAGLTMGHAILVLIAVFLFVAAGAEAGLAQVEEITAGTPAAELMITRFETLSEQSTLEDAAQALIRTSQKDFPVVDEAGRPIGMLTRDALVNAAGNTGMGSPATEAMRRDIASISEWHRLDDVTEVLGRGVPAVMVTGHGGRLSGLITSENLFEKLLLAQARSRRVLKAARHVRGVPAAHPYIS